MATFHSSSVKPPRRLGTTVRTGALTCARGKKPHPGRKRGFLDGKGSRPARQENSAYDSGRHSENAEVLLDALVAVAVTNWVGSRSLATPYQNPAKPFASV